jgi:hypothetical protein
MATTADTLAVQADAAYAEASTLAEQSLNQSQVSLDAATNAVSGLSSLGYPYTIVIPDIAANDIAAPILPTNDFSTEVKDAFDYAFASFNDVIQPQITEYITTFFPDIAAAVKTGSDQWIIDTIADGRFVPISVENAIWNRAKDRETQEAARIEQEVIDAAASRGFSAPTGVLNFTIASNQQELAKKLTSINRDIAIKDFDITNENTKFAVQQAVNLRTAFVAALGDFIRTAITQPNNATDYARLILSSKTGLYDSAVRLYSAQIDEERLRTSVLLENQNIEQRNSELGIKAFYQTVDSNISKAKVQADVALAAADQLARVAAAAYATRNSVVSVSAGV